MYQNDEKPSSAIHEMNDEIHQSYINNSNVNRTITIYKKNVNGCLVKPFT